MDTHSENLSKQTATSFFPPENAKYTFKCIDYVWKANVIHLNLHRKLSVVMIWRYGQGELILGLYKFLVNREQCVVATIYLNGVDILLWKGFSLYASSSG